jgi:hypothetical protein
MREGCEGFRERGFVVSPCQMECEVHDLVFPIEREYLDRRVVERNRSQSSEGMRNGYSERLQSWISVE